MIWTKLDYKTVSGQEVWQLVDAESNVITTAIEGNSVLMEYLAQLEAEAE